ncbi:ribosome recycling factor [Ceraceosorus guamensis]|uniref:Ribosome recycling factor n=1 Tax=Ceraceosorus guamensis TaxID=1522189 RepID=A0A316VVS4_9BASI|nr:ribosome recycling factor [Ceraceosorus guamensis]PWN40533.1 ribosome recycling factor [Ceraceosorus guamensis]
MWVTPRVAQRAMGALVQIRPTRSASTCSFLKARAMRSSSILPVETASREFECRSRSSGNGFNDTLKLTPNVEGIRHKSKKSTTKKTNATVPASEDGPAGASESRKGSSGSKSFNVGGVNSKKRSASGRTEEDWNEVLDTEEAFDADQVRENMSRSVKRAKDTVAQMVGSFGRVDPALLDPVRVPLSGTGTSKGEDYPLREVATVGVRDGALLVTCFDPEYVKAVERGLYMADLGLTPQQTGEEGVLRIPVPQPNTESRQNLLKQISNICENARTSIRSARHIAQKKIRADEKNKVVGTEIGRNDQKSLDETTKKFTAEVDTVFEQTKKKLEKDGL